MPRRDNEVKWIVFYTWDDREEAMNRLIEKWRNIDKLRAEKPERFPKGLRFANPNDDSNAGSGDSPPWGFGLYEGTEEQYRNWTEYYGPELKVTGRKRIFYISEIVQEWEKDHAEFLVIFARLIERAKGYKKI